MSWHTGWWSYVSSTGEKPKVTWPLMRRVLSYSRPYRWQIIAMLLMILFNTGLTLITPLIMRDLIDRTIPARDLTPPGLAGAGPPAHPCPGRLCQRLPAPPEFLCRRGRHL